MYYKRIFLQSIYLRPIKNGNASNAEMKMRPNHIVKSYVPLKRKKIEKRLALNYRTIVDLGRLTFQSCMTSNLTASSVGNDFNTIYQKNSKS